MLLVLNNQENNLSQRHFIYKGLRPVMRLVWVLLMCTAVALGSPVITGKKIKSKMISQNFGILLFL